MYLYSARINSIALRRYLGFYVISIRNVLAERYQCAEILWEEVYPYEVNMTLIRISKVKLLTCYFGRS